MIVSFRDRGTEDVYDSASTKRARKVCPTELHSVARKKLDYLYRARRLMDLASPPGNELEAMKGDRAGQHSIRINKQYRICFRWTDEGAERVEITDYH